MCRPAVTRGALRDLNGMTLTREERLAGAEESRRVHRELYDAVLDASGWGEHQEALNAWNAHIEGHRATAQRIRAERQK